MLCQRSLRPDLQSDALKSERFVVLRSVSSIHRIATKTRTHFLAPRGEVTVDIPRPRHNKDPRFASIVDYIYTVMTNPKAAVGNLPAPQADPQAARFPMLPHARVGGMSGLLELVNEMGGREDLPKLAQTLRLEVDDLLPTVDAAQLLGFADVVDGDVIITPVGLEFATADVQRSKDLFREQFLKNVPFVSTVVEILRKKKNGKVGKEFFIDILDEHFSNVEAENQFETLLTWGRYAQLFDYDSNEENLLRVEDEETAENEA